MGGGHETDHPVAGIVFLVVVAALLVFAARAGILGSREAMVRAEREQIVELGDAGATEQAEAKAAALAEKHPNNPRVLFLLGRIQLETGKLEDADANFARVLELEPGNWDALAERAEIHKMRDRKAEALEMMERIPAGEGHVKERLVYQLWADMAGDERLRKIAERHGLTLEAPPPPPVVTATTSSISQ